MDNYKKLSGKPNRTQDRIYPDKETSQLMSKNPPVIIIYLIILVAACQSRYQPPRNQASLNTPAQTAKLTAENHSISTQNTISGSSVPSGCTAISPKPTPGSTEQSLFPLVGPQDWLRGPITATITIIEYGDFQ
jgi:hypothetical protein